MKIPKPDTTSWDTIQKFLDDNIYALEEADNVAIKDYIIPIFKSEATDDPKVMIKFHKWLDQHIDADLRYIVTENIPMLMDATLNLYKLKVILGMRGPATEEDIIIFTKANTNSTVLKEIAKHKNFPAKAKDIMYETHNDTEYLSQEAQDIFVF